LNALLLLFIRGFGSLGLLFYQQGYVLFAEAKCAAAGEQLSINGWLSASITAPDMGFYSFHRWQ